MTLQGHLQNGVVVFDGPVPFPDGTRVAVQPLGPSPSAFWQGANLDGLAQQQGVIVADSVDNLMGGWPEDELDDGFENAVIRWRQSELEHR